MWFFIGLICILLVVSLVCEVFGLCGKGFKNKSTTLNLLEDTASYSELEGKGKERAESIHRRTKEQLEDIDNKSVFSLIFETLFNIFIIIFSLFKRIFKKFR